MAQLQTQLMSQIIENVRKSDLLELLELNESEVPHVGRIDIERMHWFAENADYFRVVRLDEHIVGFLIGLRPGSDYQSPNYRWFCEHHDDFAYCDRIAVAQSARGMGIASLLYTDFAQQMPDSVKFLTCEVNILPPNEGSMLFHQRIGFRQVGTMSNEAGDKQVAFLLKEL